MSATADDFWAGLPLGRDVAVLTRDENGVAALNKPEGILLKGESVKVKEGMVFSVSETGQS